MSLENIAEFTAAKAKAWLKASREALASRSDASSPRVKVATLSPSEIAAKGAGLTIHYSFQATPYGAGLIGFTNQGICYLSLFGETEINSGAQTSASKEAAAALKELVSLWPKAELVEDNTPSAKALVEQVFAESPEVPISVLLSGTPFQIRVWQALLGIPSGQVLSYGDLARVIGSPQSSRAVGTAVGSNKIAYLIPCHRVVRDSGQFGEFRWGPERKRAMLTRECTH